MAESSMRKIDRINVDRISELPLNIQEIILCFLPIQDAVRTTVLSTKWRHCWTTIPHLIFDHRFSILDKISQYRDSQVKAYILVSVINKVLLLHNGPILKFSLTFHQGYNFDARIVHEYVDQWIPLLARNGIKQLILKEDDMHGEFTAHEFSSLDLTYLKFTKGLFPYRPAFGVYTNMRILELVYVTSDFGQSIYDCPALEKLTLIFCTAIFPINFSAPNLKCLHHIYDEKNLEYGLPRLHNLKEFSCQIPENLVEMLLQTETSNAVQTETSIAVQTETSNVVKVLGSLDKIEKFTIGLRFHAYLAAGGSPNRLSKPLPYLKTLNMCDINFTHLSEVSCLLCLIRSAPNLHKLQISSYVVFGEEEDLKDYRIEDSEDCTIDHLEIVTFSSFRGLKAELELIKFLLGHSPLLKRMSLHRSPNIKKDVAFALGEEILQYSRASSRVQIRELKDPVIIDGYDDVEWDDIIH
ncbi:FBD domain-containing protein [Heracleum sosnowskyi]|uniref:FBD domain-containing protein n=1 Tax=Heracleum sosnowskyi TaxID=360622 RepID=A0AAD8GX46_9APIA|nr:FBD domain-containing protein [Heracleum sosnowskyi]